MSRDADAVLRRRGGLARTQRLTGPMLALPALAFYGVFIGYPLFHGVATSLYEDNLFTSPPQYVGARNFHAFFGNTLLVQALPVTLIFVVGSTLLAFALGLFWALVLSQRFRGRTLLRALSLLPWLLPSTVTAFLWAWIFNANYGVLNSFLLRLHVVQHTVAWLAGGNTAMAAVIIARAWMSLPWFMTVFLAGLLAVPFDVVEAARVDGGGNLIILRSVVLPHLRFTMWVALILGGIGNLQLFDLIYAMTGGGPVNDTTVLSLLVYQQAFQSFDQGMAATIGVIWLAALLPLTALYLWTIRRGDGGA